MSRTYDNWERLVDAVLRRELIWLLCHEQSMTPSPRSSISSDFSSSSSSSSSASLHFENSKDGFCDSAESLPFKTVAHIRASVTPETEEVACPDSPFAFSPEELLMAPSFVLGDEFKTFTNTYVVSCKENIMVVVKRLFRGMATLTYEAFKHIILTIESIKHENVVMLRGYFYTGYESHAFYDYFHQRSVHAMLHGQESSSFRLGTRIRIAIGAAKGLLHIHRQRSGKFVHGNIKASNIFINSQGYGCIDIKPINIRISEYHPREFSVKKGIFQASDLYSFQAFEAFDFYGLFRASDIYSFGVLLIELLSGRSPLHHTGRHETLADWALHDVRDEWTVLVFDRGLLKYSLAKKGMRDMLLVALFCMKEEPEERPNMKDVVEMMELIPTTFSV